MHYKMSKTHKKINLVGGTRFWLNFGALTLVLPTPFDYQASLYPFSAIFIIFLCILLPKTAIILCMGRLGSQRGLGAQVLMTV
jgi:hypothetical protein